MWPFIGSHSFGVRSPLFIPRVPVREGTSVYEQIQYSYERPGDRFMGGCVYGARRPCARNIAVSLVQRLPVVVCSDGDYRVRSRTWVYHGSGNRSPRECTRGVGVIGSFWIDQLRHHAWGVTWLWIARYWLSSGTFRTSRWLHLLRSVT